MCVVVDDEVIHPNPGGEADDKGNQNGTTPNEGTRHTSGKHTNGSTHENCDHRSRVLHLKVRLRPYFHADGENGAHWRSRF